jgi:peptide/nickel transport system permease protein
MLIYILKRFIYALPIALCVSALTFALVYMAPGDPLNAIAPGDASAEMVQALKVTYGFDQPIPVQYVKWLWRAAHGDLGVSIASGRSVTSEVGSALKNTLFLALIASGIGVLFGFLLGGLAGLYKDSWIDRLSTFVSLIGVSIPHYWLGLVLTIIFSVWLGWFPAMGGGSATGWAWDFEHFKYVILPAITLSVIPAGIITRSVRALVSDVLNREFVVSLRARGLSEGAILRHVARNALPTVLAVAGLQIGYLMGGSILVETVFSWPGTGFLLNIAIFQRDIPLLQGIVLVLCLIFVFLNLLVDIVQSMLDPRMKRS